ncbi:ComF family protein [Saccharothrix lopnurensis]|uniref:ComF family protein n=1 Tax=Saccharothrix lopnurensis TaxID=1670621 RepID=A0ABW1PI82_9PSEU
MSPHSLLRERYSNVLVAPPSVDTSICRVCRRDTNQFTRCYPCHRHQADFGSELANTVMPISIAVKGDQLARELWRYKNSSIDRERRDFTNGLAYVLAAFLQEHESCLARAAGVDGFEVVTSVPSTRSPEPLAGILSGKVGRTSRRFTTLLRRVAPHEGRLRPDAVIVVGNPAGRSVLLVDDTWTTGASLQSAAVALRRAGARAIAGLVVGRHFDPTYERATAYLEKVRSRPFDWGVCGLCRTGLA